MREKPSIIDVHAHVPADPVVMPHLLASARKHGVKRMLLSSLGRREWKPLPTQEEVHEANTDAFALCERYPESFGAYAYLNVQQPWRDELERWQQHDAFVGVKLWLSMKSEEGSTQHCLPLLEYAAAERFPVLCHSFFLRGPNIPGEANPADIADLSAQVPEARLLMAHVGGMWERGLPAIADRPNVFVDISGGPCRRGLVEHAIALCGLERVLFGSDVPCRTFASQLHKVYGADISEKDKTALLTGNAVKFFGEGIR